MSFAQELNRIVGSKVAKNEGESNKKSKSSSVENEINVEDYEAKLLAVKIYHASI